MLAMTGAVFFADDTCVCTKKEEGEVEAAINGKHNDEEAEGEQEQEEKTQALEVENEALESVARIFVAEERKKKKGIKKKNIN